MFWRIGIRTARRLMWYGPVMQEPDIPQLSILHRVAVAEFGPQNVMLVESETAGILQQSDLKELPGTLQTINVVFVNTPKTQALKLP